MKSYKTFCKFILLNFRRFNPPFKLYMHSIYEQHPNNLKSNRNLCKFILPNFQTFRYNIPWLSLKHDLNLPEVTLLFCWLSWALFLSLEVGVERLLRELLRLELLWDPPSLQEGFVIVGHLLPLLNGDGNLQKVSDYKWPFKNNVGNQFLYSTTKNRSSWPEFPKRLERKFLWK